VACEEPNPKDENVERSKNDNDIDLVRRDNNWLFLAWKIRRGRGCLPDLGTWPGGEPLVYNTLFIP